MKFIIDIEKEQSRHVYIPSLNHTLCADIMELEPI